MSNQEECHRSRILKLKFEAKIKEIVMERIGRKLEKSKVENSKLYVVKTFNDCPIGFAY